MRAVDPTCQLDAFAARVVVANAMMGLLHVVISEFTSGLDLQVKKVIVDNYIVRAWLCFDNGVFPR